MFQLIKWMAIFRLTSFDRYIYLFLQTLHFRIYIVASLSIKSLHFPLWQFCQQKATAVKVLEINILYMNFSYTNANRNGSYSKIHNMGIEGNDL